MPRDDPLPTDLGLPVAAVARRLGIAAATLRTWDRRYGLGPSGHRSGAHRRYTTDDLQRLETMRRLVVEGVAPAVAAAAARGSGPSGSSMPDAGSATPSRAADGLDTPDAAARTAVHGGHVLALPHADAEVRGLARAAVALDAPSISTQLLDALDRDGVAVTWDRLIRPVLVAVGDRWEATGRGVDVEHLLSECALGALRTVALRALHANHAPPVLLACVPEEQHSLPLAALAAALGERNIPTRFLGARVPLDALSAAVRRLRPAVLVLFSQLPATADPGAVAAVPPLRPAVRVLLAGAGWHPHTAPQRAEFVADLPAAVERVSAALYRARANSNPAPDDAE